MFLNPRSRKLKCIIAVLSVLSLTCCSTNVLADGSAVTESIKTLPVQNTRHHIRQKTQELLTLVNLNLAHGRGLSLNQLLVSSEKTKKNLVSIADFLIKVDGDIVALQEADAPSSWSGNFNHVQFLASHGGYPQFVQAIHAEIMIGNYGTGVMSRLPIKAAYELTFPPSLPTASKGLTLAEIEWRTGSGPITFDVISVHLDFSRESVRKRQLDEIKTTLSRRNNPVIVMGDFNSELIAKKLLNSKFDNSLSLRTFSEEDRSLHTYKNKRLDWILVSSDFVIENYEISPVRLSDHRAVVATVSLAPPTNGD